MPPGTSLRPSPWMEALIRGGEKAEREIEIAAFGRASGFNRLRIDRSSPLFSSLLSVLAGGLESVPSPHLLSLWHAGVLADSSFPQAPALVARADAGEPGEPGLALVRRLHPEAALLFDGPCPVSTVTGDFAADSYAELRGLLSPAETETAAAYYHRLAEAGLLKRGDAQSDRFMAHNDPLGRALARRLRPAVEAAAGQPVKPSYCYAALYMPGTELGIHTDRAQCAYTLSLLLDHRPEPADRRGPWPLRLIPSGRETPVALTSELGGGILFRGDILPHFRGPLPEGQRCTALMLHYVAADFAGSLD